MTKSEILSDLNRQYSEIVDYADLLTKDEKEFFLTDLEKTMDTIRARSDTSF